MKLTKKVVAFCAAGIMALAIFPISAAAKTLKDSFSGGSYVSYHHYDWLTGDHYTKSAWAKTVGYTGNHYVRAMVGSGNNVWADTNRCYSNGDIQRTCTTGSIPCKGFSWEFPTAYAYYGT